MVEQELNTERERMLDWISASWDQLAAFAWRGYVLDGRGLVVLQGSWDDDVVVAYQTPEMADAVGLVWPSELHDAVRQYQPTTEIVFLVQAADAGILLGMRTPGARLSPREAGQRDGSAPLVLTA